MNYIIIALIWIAYCTLHSYLISIRFTRFIKARLKSYYAFYRLFYVLSSIFLLLPVYYFTQKLQSEIIITYVPPWSVIRYTLIAFSLLVFLKAFLFDYDFLSFLGIRQAFNFRRNNIIHEDGLKKTGLLGIVRHPMYSAVILFLWCQTFRLTDIVVNTMLTLYFVIGTILEERKLLLEFGDAYIRYQQEIPMLIPFTKRNYKQ